MRPGISHSKVACSGSARVSSARVILHVWFCLRVSDFHADSLLDFVVCARVLRNKKVASVSLFDQLVLSVSFCTPPHDGRVDSARGRERDIVSRRVM